MCSGKNEALLIADNHFYKSRSHIINQLPEATWLIIRARGGSLFMKDFRHAFQDGRENSEFFLKQNSVIIEDTQKHYLCACQDHILLA